MTSDSFLQTAHLVIMLHIHLSAMVSRELFWYSNLLPFVSSLAFCVARSASQCRAEGEEPSDMEDRGSFGEGAATAAALASVSPEPSVPDSGLGAVESPSALGVAVLAAPPLVPLVLDAAPDCTGNRKCSFPLPFNLAGWVTN